MRKLVESTYVSLDGMVSGESFWGAQARFQDDKHVAYAAKLLESADALVLGRATYEAFAASWPGRTGKLADRINSLPKYVASRTLTGATWNSQILPGDAVEAVAKLKQPGEGTLLKYGTGSFSRALLEGGQLDELHLWVYPFIGGSGEPLLPGITTTHLDLAEVNQVGNGVVVLTYKPKRWPRNRCAKSAAWAATAWLRRVACSRSASTLRGYGRAVPGMMSGGQGGSVR